MAFGLYNVGWCSFGLCCLLGVFREEPLCAQHSHFVVVVLRVIYRGHHSKLPSAQ